MNKEEIKTLLKETVINYQNGHAVTADSEIGRASCRERVCRSV